MIEFRHGEYVKLVGGKTGRVIRGPVEQEYPSKAGVKLLVSIDGGGILPVSPDEIIEHQRSDYVTAPTGKK